MKGDFMKEAYGSQKTRIAVRGRSIMLMVLGWVSAVLSVFVYPFIFGFLGVVSGILASKYQSKAGLPLVVASIALMAVGLMFGNSILDYAMQIFNYMR